MRVEPDLLPRPPGIDVPIQAAANKKLSVTEDTCGAENERGTA